MKNKPNLFDVVELTVDWPEVNYASNLQITTCFGATTGGRLYRNVSDFTGAYL
jgi:hypothetical protein